MNSLKPIIFITTSFLISLLLFTVVSAQNGIDNLAIENLSMKAVEEYKKGEYPTALSLFEDLYKIRFKYPSKNIVHYMYGKTLYKLGKYENALSVQKDFLLNYPDHPLAENARYNLGEIYYRLGEYPKATREFLTVAVNAKSALLRNKGLTLAGNILENKVTISDIRKQRKETVNIVEKAYLTLKLSENLNKMGATRLARKEAATFLANYKNPPFKEDIKRIRDGKVSVGKSVVNIGVLLPLTGENADNGLSILRGIKTAFNEHPPEIRKMFKLTIRDNESDQVKTVKEMIKFADDPSVMAVIGPMMSDNSTAAAAIANSAGLPMISPTATRDGIAGIGSFSLQANSDLTVRGKSLARFAIDSLGLKRIAILSPANDYGKQMTDSFASEIDARGGEIVAQSWYYGEPKNLRSQFKQFRTIGFRIHEELYPTEEPPDSAAILYDSTLSDSVIMEMLAELAKPVEEIDSGKVILDVIDGFYLPIEYGEIKYLAPQFAFWNFKTQILGGQNWYDEEMLLDKDISRYLNGVIFTSDIYRGSENSALQNLKNRYKELYNEEPVRTDIFGYDCLNMVLQLIGDKVRTRENFIQKIGELTDFQGVSGVIDFTGAAKRVNNSIHILQFFNKEIVKIN